MHARIVYSLEMRIFVIVSCTRVIFYLPVYVNIVCNLGFRVLRYPIMTGFASVILQNHKSLQSTTLFLALTASEV